ncbi:cupin domain-containing protein [Candidatus Poribacteria bacterium]|nr:cupin domain-containing protein [Candidatus Poribacteria bacterium]
MFIERAFEGGNEQKMNHGPGSKGSEFARRPFPDDIADTFVVWTRLQPNSAVGRHLQPTWELYYIVSGTGRFTLDDEEATVSAGDLLYTPGGSWHSIENTGNCELCIFVVGK